MALRTVCGFPEIFKRSALWASAPNFVVTVFHPLKNSGAWFRFLLMSFNEITDFWCHGFILKLFQLAKQLFPFFDKPFFCKLAFGFRIPIIVNDGVVNSRFQIADGSIQLVQFLYGFQQPELLFVD